MTDPALDGAGSDGVLTEETLLRWVEAASPSSQLARRGVESQHEIATLALVDTREEHELLEALLEAPKPPLPAWRRPHRSSRS